MRPDCLKPARCRLTLTRLPGAALAVLALISLAVPAGPTVPASRPDPLDPLASVPALRYSSPFKTDGRPEADQPLSWRDANDSVARIGGWRVYAREAQQPEPGPAAKPSPPGPPPATLPPGHAGHKTP